MRYVFIPSLIGIILCVSMVSAWTFDTTVTPSSSLITSGEDIVVKGILSPDPATDAYLPIEKIVVTLNGPDGSSLGHCSIHYDGSFCEGGDLAVVLPDLRDGEGKGVFDGIAYSFGEVKGINDPLHYVWILNAEKLGSGEYTVTTEYIIGRNSFSNGPTTFTVQKSVIGVKIQDPVAGQIQGPTPLIVTFAYDIPTELSCTGYTQKDGELALEYSTVLSPETQSGKFETAALGIGTYHIYVRCSNQLYDGTSQPLTVVIVAPVVVQTSTTSDTPVESSGGGSEEGNGRRRTTPTANTLTPLATTPDLTSTATQTDSVANTPAGITGAVIGVLGRPGTLALGIFITVLGVAAGLVYNRQHLGVVKK